MNEAPLAHWLAGLEQRRPELSLAMPYLAPADRTACAALACLLAELIDSVHAIQEPTVAITKLGWWAEECGAGGTRHPLTREVFGHPRSRWLPAEAWRSAIDAGMALRESPPAADLAAQIEALQPFHGALADIEQAYWRGNENTSRKAGQLAVLAQLVRRLSAVDSNCAVAADSAPMQLLARHGLNRGQLASDGDPQRRLALDQLKTIRQKLEETARMRGSVNLFRLVSAHADSLRLRRASRSTDPRAKLASGSRRAGLSLAWFAWRTARVEPSSLPKQLV